MGYGNHFPEIEVKNVYIFWTIYLKSIPLTCVNLGVWSIFELIKKIKKALQTIREEFFDDTTYQNQIEAIHDLCGQVMERITNKVKSMALNPIQTKGLYLRKYFAIHHLMWHEF